MDDKDSIQVLRRRVQELEEEFVTLAASRNTKPAEVAKALDLVALELHDTDRALFEAVFLRNDSEIRKLISEIEAATQGGKEILNRLEELNDAVGKAREVVQRATANVGKIKGLLDEVDEVMSLAKGQASH